MPKANKKVLIIDDDKSILFLLELDIEDAGMQAINPGAVKSVEEALEKIKKYEAETDFILLDMNYGKVCEDKRSDGYNVAEKLSKEMIGKVICASSFPWAYKDILRPLGVKHFGGKKEFINCLVGTCNCETVD